MESFWSGHMTWIEQLPDGRVVSRCQCGWQSEPQSNRAALGWACPREREAREAARKTA
jgi:hypothetical protein